MNKLKVTKAVQLILKGGKAKIQTGVTVIGAEEWLSQKIESEF